MCFRGVISGINVAFFVFFSVCWCGSRADAVIIFPV